MEEQIKVVIRFQRLDVYGAKENVNLHVKRDITLSDLKVRIYKRLNVEVERQELSLKLPGKVVDLADEDATLVALGIENCSMINLEETQLPQEILDEPDSDEEETKAEPKSPAKPMYNPSYFYKIGIVPRGMAREEEECTEQVD